MIQVTIESADSQELQKTRKTNTGQQRKHVVLGKTRVEKDEKHAKWVVGRLKKRDIRDTRK